MGDFALIRAYEITKSAIVRQVLLELHKAKFGLTILIKIAKAQK
jgi:hypothetical protein